MSFEIKFGSRRDGEYTRDPLHSYSEEAESQKRPQHEGRGRGRGHWRGRGRGGRCRRGKGGDRGSHCEAQASNSSEDSEEGGESDALSVSSVDHGRRGAGRRASGDWIPRGENRGRGGRGRSEGQSGSAANPQPPRRAFDSSEGNFAKPGRAGHPNFNRADNKGCSQSREERRSEPRGWVKKGGEEVRDEEAGPSWDQRRKVNRQDVAQPAGQEGSVPELSADDWVKVFNLLLEKFEGRTKLGTFAANRGGLLRGLRHEQMVEWFKRSNRFLIFEYNERPVKFVSINFREARLCFKYTTAGTETCGLPSCPYFHVCRDFVVDACSKQSRCSFSHSFHSMSNAQVCASIGLQAFSDDDIRVIVLRSIPVVCRKFNQEGCSDECPDLHLCSRFIQKDCNEEQCNFGHSVKGTEHNDRVLEVFHMMKIPEHTLLRLVLVSKVESAKIGMKPKDAESQNKGSDISRSRSREHLFKNAELQPKIKGSDISKTRSTEYLSKTAKLPPTKSAGFDKARSGEAPVRSQEKGSLKPESGEGRHCSQEKGSLKPESGEGRHRSSAVSKITMAAASEVGEVGNSLEGDGVSLWAASHYTHLCERHTWGAECGRGALCAGYHGNDRCPFQWQVRIHGQWHALSAVDNHDVEKFFCALIPYGTFEVVLEDVGGLKLHVDFSNMKATIADSSCLQALDLDRNQVLDVRRWSTPSYVETDGSTPLTHYTQWCWYHTSEVGTFEPFYPGELQYTLEQKYITGQLKYYFETRDSAERFVLDLQEMKLVGISSGELGSVIRRPIFVSPSQSEPPMSTLLLEQAPLYPGLPDHWAALDAFQDFELVELGSCSSEFLDVLRRFHASLAPERIEVGHVFRVQNPSLWDKFCSTKRAMARRGESADTVDERRLFHGTPSLTAVHGICTNNVDFRRSGENVGTLYGRGAYFSATARYSHSYTGVGPSRYMFVSRVLVGRYTKGTPNLTFPPVREGNRLYNSCVDNEASPAIFVIFDLAQSYPEYLIEYIDAQDVSMAAMTASSARSPQVSQVRPVPVPRVTRPCPIPPPVGAEEGDQRAAGKTPASHQGPLAPSPRRPDSGPQVVTNMSQTMEGYKQAYQQLESLRDAVQQAGSGSKKSGKYSDRCSIS